jgi:PLP dependent protein
MTSKLRDMQNLVAQLGQEFGQSRSVQIIAVSKTKPPSAVEALHREGQLDFGENYVDELVEKANALKDFPHIRWIFIGQLQSNKIKKIMSWASEIQTVASEKQARYVDRYALELGKSPFPIYIQVNAGNEEQKSGVSETEAQDLARYILHKCPHVLLKGIMVIPPAQYSDKNNAVENDPDNVTPSATELYGAMRDLASKIGVGKLSMGMSSDLKLAIKHGSDCIRIGTALFGPRT